MVSCIVVHKFSHRIPLCSDENTCTYCCGRFWWCDRPSRCTKNIMKRRRNAPHKLYSIRTSRTSCLYRQQDEELLMLWLFLLMGTRQSKVINKNTTRARALDKTDQNTQQTRYSPHLTDVNSTLHCWLTDKWSGELKRMNWLEWLKENEMNGNAHTMQIELSKRLKRTLRRCMK